MDDRIEEQPRNNGGKRLGGATGKGFMPGRSGNPGGRPRGRSITAALRRLMDDTEIGGKALPPGETVADLLARVIRKAALEGDVHFMRMYIERTEGPVAAAQPEATDEGHADGGDPEFDGWAMQRAKALEARNRAAEPGGPGGADRGGPVGMGPAPGPAQ